MFENQCMSTLYNRCNNVSKCSNVVPIILLSIQIFGTWGHRIIGCAWVLASFNSVFLDGYSYKLSIWAIKSRLTSPRFVEWRNMDKNEYSSKRAQNGLKLSERVYIVPVLGPLNSGVTLPVGAPSRIIFKTWCQFIIGEKDDLWRSNLTFYATCYSFLKMSTTWCCFITSPNLDCGFVNKVWPV